MSVKVRAPEFWSRTGHPLALLLALPGMIYGAIVRGRFFFTRPYRAKLPVICVGNFTMGGGGKTPLSLEIARLLQERGLKPAFLTRGYGGRVRGPHTVDRDRDDAGKVGDEPLILARLADVVVSADRVAGARYIEKRGGVDVILMDDGFQNPALHKDLSLVVVDETTGVGNGHVFPAGPLRASLSWQMSLADMLVIAGPLPVGGKSATRKIEKAFSGDILRCDLVATGETDLLQGRRVMAVTGIARPDKFYDSLQRSGAVIVQMYDYPDHYAFTEKDAEDLLQLSITDEAEIIMTRKDYVRLPDSGNRGSLREKARVLDVEMRIDQPEKLLKRIEEVISFVSRYNA